MNLRHLPADDDLVAEFDAEFEDDDLVAKSDAEFEDDEFEEQEDLEDWPLDEDVRRLLHDR